MSIHTILHNLWSRDVGTEGYDKAKWKDLEARILRLERMHTEAQDALEAGCGYDGCVGGNFTHCGHCGEYT